MNDKTLHQESNLPTKESNGSEVKSIYDLAHKVRLEKGKRVMTCIEHFCDIDSMPEGEYYKQKRLKTKGNSG